MFYLETATNENKELPKQHPPRVKEACQILIDRGRRNCEILSGSSPEQHLRVLCCVGGVRSEAHI